MKQDFASFQAVSVCDNQRNEFNTTASRVYVFSTWPARSIPQSSFPALYCIK